MKTKFMSRTALGMLLALGLSYSSVAMAKDVLLAETKVLYKKDTVKAQLWGNKVNSSYTNSLTLVLKREDGSVITGYTPDIKGGYGAVLKAVQVKAKDKDTQQLLLGIRQGDWQTYNEYRVLDITNPKSLKELFRGSDSFGVVTSAKLEGNTLFVATVRDKEPLKVELNPKMVEDISDNRRQVSFGRLHSMTALDINEDGVNELFTNQQITVDNRILADVGAVWRYIGSEKDEDEAKSKSDSEAKQQKEAKKDSTNILKTIEEGLEALGAELKGEQEAKAEEDKASKAKADKLWRQDALTIMKSDVPNKKNSVNDGAFFNGGMVYPVKMVSPGGEATYPQVMLNENVEVEAAWNKILLAESEEYLKRFLRGTADLAFNVIRADKKLVTIQLISGKDKFVHHNISFIPGEKEKYELKALLDVKSKDLVELLNVLNNNDKLTWDASLTDEWYIRNDDLYLMKNIDGKDEVASFDIKNLKKYIKDQRFLPEEEKEEKPQAKNEKKSGADLKKE